MSSVVFERVCPKCSKGAMVYRSSTKLLGNVIETKYVRFVCDSCYHVEEVI